MFACAEDFFTFTLYYNSYDNLIEKNLLENMFGIEVTIVFQDNFNLKMQQNNIYFLFFKIYF